MKKSFRIVSILLAFLLSCSLIACGSKEPSADNKLPADGEIGTNSGADDEGGGWFDRWFSGKADADAPMDSAPDAAEPAGGYESGDASDDVVPSEPGDGMIGGADGDGFKHQAGQLTGSEWNDNDHFDAFVEKMNGQSNGWYAIAEAWGTVATQRLHVKVQNGQTPVKQAKVQLLDDTGEVLWSAVTDADGDAYYSGTSEREIRPPQRSR